MKATVAVLTLVALASASPKVSNLGFRNLYKQPISPISPKPGPRIIGGQEATPHSIPYQAFLEIQSLYEAWYCSGTLISPNYILTAAHCNNEGWDALVILGAHDISQEEPTQVTGSAAMLRLHEEYYYEDQIINDVGLIQLRSPVELSSAVQLARLPSRADASKDYVGSIARASGWGLTDGHDTALSPVLRYVDLQVITNSECEESFGPLSSTILCTSGSQNTGACSGDSGGPLTVDGVQIGLVSFGAQYCSPGYPSAFSRITSFLDWIENNTDVTIA